MSDGRKKKKCNSKEMGEFWKLFVSYLYEEQKNTDSCYIFRIGALFSCGEPTNVQS
jgi:hypothetical protein